MKISCRTPRYSVPFKRDLTKRVNRTNLFESCFRRNAAAWFKVTAGRRLRCHPRPVPFASDLERSGASTASVTSSMYETDGPLVGDSEKATAKKRVVPVSRTRICHVTRPATPLSPLSKILLARTLHPVPSPLPPFRHSSASGRSLNLPGHLHPRYLASRPRRRLLIRGFTESKTLNAHRSPVEVG